MFSLGILLAALLAEVGPARGAELATPPKPRAVEVVKPPAAEAAKPTSEPLPDTDTRVAVLAALGERLYKLGRYDEAVAEYRRAYELRADPKFLYHIARCYRELGASEQALFYYERYLAVAPAAPERDEVMDRIAEIEALRARPARPRTRPILIADQPAKASTPSKPWRKWWFWTALGTAVATGVAAAMFAGDSEVPRPAGTLGNKMFY
jgi:tetratricopeptide (TPR) repeat protein